MRLIAHSLLVAVLFVLGGGPAQAAGFPQIERLEVRARAAVQAYQKADDSLSDSHARYDELAHRIAALKRLGSRGNTNATLERLLQASVAASQELSSKAQLRDARAHSAEALVISGIRAIDAAIVARKPALRSSTRARRANAAKELKALVASRQKLAAELNRLARSGGEQPKAWAEYQVKIDPLDGPEDLRTKADHLEDTRDVFKKKRAALNALLARAKEEREIARAADNFRVDTRLFDEAARRDRVRRQGGGDRGGILNFGSAEEATLANPTGARDAAGATGGGGQAAPPPAAPADPASAPPEPAPGGTDNDGTTADDANNGAFSGDKSEVQAPSAPAAAAALTLPKQLDPDALLNLQVGRIDPSAMSVAQLEALMGDLNELDSVLDRRAKQIRQRATRLEHDESKALGDVR